MVISLPAFKVYAGKRLTDAKAVSGQFPEKPVTVYIEEVKGYALTADPVVELNPLDGLQTYVLAPLAVNVTVSPGQIVEIKGLTETEREDPTVIVVNAVSTQLPVPPITE